MPSVWVRKKAPVLVWCARLVRWNTKTGGAGAFASGWIFTAAHMQHVRLLCACFCGYERLYILVVQVTEVAELLRQGADLHAVDPCVRSHRLSIVQVPVCLPETSIKYKYTRNVQQGE